MKLARTLTIAAFMAFTTVAFADDSAIREILERQAAAWNDGNLEGFMDGYLKSEDLVFTSGGNVRRGWETTFRGYQKTYGNAKETMGHLGFSEIEVHMLGREGAWVLGRWKLTYGDGRTEGGIFTLVLTLKDDGWVIVHDHTSSDPD